MCVGIATATTPKKSNTKGINPTSYEDRPLWYQSMNRQSSEAKDKGQPGPKASRNSFVIKAGGKGGKEQFSSTNGAGSGQSTGKS